MDLKIFEFLVNLATLLRFRVANTDSCSNNENVFVINYNFLGQILRYRV